MLDIYGQLAIGHVKGLKEARRSAPKSEIRLQRRARETGGWWWCMPQGIGLAAGFCWLLLLFASYWVAIVQEFGGDLTQRPLLATAAGLAPAAELLVRSPAQQDDIPCWFEIAVTRFPRQY